jgi:Uma2 family endonuclease
VEVAGQDEEERVLREKAHWYVQNGVPIIWLVLPDTREVVVIVPTGASRFGRADRLPRSDLRPGLEPEVSRFFLQLER